MANTHSEHNKIERGRAKPAPAKPASKVEGEGSYTASKDYKDSIDNFIKTKGGQIDKLAREAAHDVDADKSGELKKAEKEGRSHAKK